MLRSLAPCLLLLLLCACPSGGTDHCTATYTCSAGDCTCDDGTTCSDPAEADDEAEANCLNLCEICEE